LINKQVFFFEEANFITHIANLGKPEPKRRWISPPVGHRRQLNRF